MTRAAVEAALGRLDRDALAAERWFAAKGRTIVSIELEDAFELDAGASHVLAVARLGLDDGSSQRYTFALTGRPLRPAEPGDGAWRALAAAMADGRVDRGDPGRRRARLPRRPPPWSAGRGRR